MPKKIINFLEPEEQVPLKLYLIVIAEHVNASGLRIDEVATLDQYTENESAQQAAIVAAGMQKLDEIAENQLRPAPAPVEKKPATRKTTTKKTTTKRKTTTRKTTAKKTTTRKTTRKPAAKKEAKA
ncbi:hypothetical protein [Lacticaseibacillus manihotivorans]|uniref:hypothetical protein n=1 Tax=Lacticaseibacillus manihotivorans TaxID=88233 RepID=UPI000A575635|nr:hypothetical protein [Lacticaseibacillus manihotivorans]